MKRALILLLAAMMLFSGCSSKKDDSMVENYKIIATEYANQGNTERAIEILNEGYEKTNDESLLAMAEGLKLADSGDKDEPVTPAVKPVTKSEPVTDTEYVQMALNSEETRKLNIFISNFTEVYSFGNYNQNQFSNEQLIKFAFRHHMINSDDKIIFTDRDMGISASDAQETIDRFLGVGLPLRSYGQWEYKNGGFYTTAAFGDPYGDIFSIVTDVKKHKSNGTYKVWFSNFQNGEYEAGAPKMEECYSLSQDEALRRCAFDGTGIAIVREKEYKGKTVYELLSLEHYM